jgi:hypothetical protein
MERNANGTVTATRDEIHSLVWSRPRREVAASMDVTDFLLTEACRKAGIPTPSAGHWTKASLGKAPPPTPLPPAPEGVSETVTVGRPPRLPPAADDPGAGALPSVAVPERLRDPHPLVAEAQASLARQVVAGDVAAMWQKPGRFHIRVGRDSVDRVLRFLDAVLKAVEARGHTVSAGQWKWWVTVGAAHIGMRVDAAYEEVPRAPKPDDAKWMRQSPGWRPPVTEWVPTPRLALKMEGYGYGLRGTFSDGKRQSLETLATEVVATILAVAERRRKEKEEQEERERLWAEEKMRREEAERRRREEERRVADLRADAAAWREASTLREYIAAVRVSASPEPDADVLRWLEWASAKADGIDPLVRGLPTRGENADDQLS